MEGSSQRCLKQETESARGVCVHTVQRGRGLMYACTHCCDAVGQIVFTAGTQQLAVRQAEATVGTG